MGENRHHHPSSSRLGVVRNTGAAAGEIVEVRGGGHIVRATGRKDRHSKVCTAKGPRDRRVRLSAHTAIQFYDVQDRLGYDRPSKAVDWLIKKAKPAIDELAELPAWKPTTAPIQNPNFRREIHDGDGDFLDTVAGPSCKRTMMGVGNGNQSGAGNGSSFLPASMDSDAIADTIKTFFPMEASAEANSSGMQFQSFTQQKPGSHSQDLRLSLQSFQDPTILLHHHHPAAQHQNPPPVSHGEAHNLFTGAVAATQLGFDASGCSEHHENHQRLAAWNAAIDAAAAGGERVSSGTEGYLFNSPPPPLYQQLFGGHHQFLSSQRGPLQSSNTPWIRAWTEPSPATAIASAADPSQHQTTMIPIYPSPLSSIGFASGVDGFSGFRIPARIQGEEEEHDGISDKLSSASSDSCR